MASQHFSFFSFHLSDRSFFLSKSSVSDAVWKAWSWHLEGLPGVAHVDFTVFFFFLLPHMQINWVCSRYKTLSVCDNCTWILNGLRGPDMASYCFFFFFPHMWPCVFRFTVVCGRCKEITAPSTSPSSLIADVRLSDWLHNSGFYHT